MHKTRKPKPLGLGAHTGLRAGISEDDFWKMFSSDDNRLSPQRCPSLSAIASQLMYHGESD